MYVGFIRQKHWHLHIKWNSSSMPLKYWFKFNGTHWMCAPNQRRHFLLLWNISFKEIRLLWKIMLKLYVSYLIYLLILILIYIQFYVITISTDSVFPCYDNLLIDLELKVEDDLNHTIHMLRRNMYLLQTFR